MEARFAKLKDTLQKISVTFVRMDERLSHLATEAGIERLRTEVVALAGKVDGKAGAADLAELKGKVGRIPTVPVLAGLLTVTATAVAWPWVVRHLFS